MGGSRALVARQGGSWSCCPFFALMASPETAPLVLNARAADSEVHTDEVCFIVQNEGDPEPSHV